MNVLLVRPPSIMGREHSHAMQHPVNLCWLAARGKEEGFRTRILDYEIQRYTPEHFSSTIMEFKPRIIGFTSMTPSIDIVGAMAEVSAETKYRVVNVAGGPHVSILPVETLRKYPKLHAVVMGEGEAAFLEICRAVREQSLGRKPIPSVIINNGNEFIGEKDKIMSPIDLDKLPVPARELLDLKRYSGAPTPGIPHAGSSATEIFTARGCPGKCIFCCSEHVFGRRVRSRGVDHVIHEIKDCIERFGFKHFTIDNDTFTYNREFVMKFCDEISKLNATWDCDTRVDRVDDEMIRAMADSGCLKIAFGVETGSAGILKLIRKGITLDQVREAFRMTRAAGIMSCAFLMLGNHPEETEPDIAATRSFVNEIQPDLISVALATPYPGTQLHNLMKEAGCLEDRPWSDYSQSFQGTPFIRTRTISSARLLKLQTQILRRFYLRPGYIMGRLARLRSLKEVLYWFGAGLGFIKYIFQRGRARVSQKQ